MLSVDDIVPIDETKNGVNDKLCMWEKLYKSKGFKIRSKTEYMEYTLAVEGVYLKAMLG